MATLMELLRELPAPVYAEVRSMVMSLGPKATPDEMLGAVTGLSTTTREATLALLVTHVQEEILAARAAIADARTQQDENPPDGEGNPGTSETNAG